MKVKAVYDNGGASCDRFTIVFDESYINQNHGKLWYCIGSSSNPTHPQGFFQHCECTLGRHLGRKIKFEELPAEVQAAVNRDIAEEVANG